ncbi:unnamed protein product, partial [Iphiclides podalirius]
MSAIMRESLRRLAGSASEDGMESRRGNTRRVRVELLDGDYISVDVDRKARGGDLLDKVCIDLEITEVDYFGLLYTCRGDTRSWMNLERRLSKTFRNDPWEVRFAVKFYPPEPSGLRDDNTRYQLALAVRRDLLEGRLACSQITHALLASYILQAELGDRETRVDGARLALLTVLPQTLALDLEDQVDELYGKHRGQTPAEAELSYLENAKKLLLYGAELHSAKDSDDVDIALAVSSRGVTILRDGVPMNRFPWTMITKISYKKRSFSLRLRPAECEEHETSLGFRLCSSRGCKKLWRCCVEFHIFFRRAAPVRVERVPGWPRLGRRHLSCRRTLRQLAPTAPPHPPPPPPPMACAS